MTEGIRNLVNLQEIDLKLRELEKSASSHPIRLKEIDDDLSADRLASDQKQSELDEIESQRKSIEGQIQLSKEQIKKWESRLMDIKTPREYAALSREIDIAKKGIKNQEEEILNLMEQAEALKTEIESIERTILEKEQGYESERSELHRQLETLESQRNKLNEVRKEITGSIDKSLLTNYEKIRSRRAGISMACVCAGGTCGVCRMRIQPRIVNELVSGGGNSLIQCPSCFRILYIPEEKEEDEG